MRYFKTAARFMLLPIGLVFALEIFLRIAAIPDYLFPRPTLVGERLLSSFSLYGDALLVTLTEASLGFLVGTSAALLFGLVFAHSKSVRNLAYPFVIALQSVPIVALAPYLVIWFGDGLAGKVILSAIIAYFPAVIVATEEFGKINSRARSYFYSLGASSWRTLLHLEVPLGIPVLLTSLKISLPLAVVGALVAELAGSSKGIGFLILQSSYNFDTPALFAALVAISTVTVTAFFLLKALSDYYARKYRFGTI